MANARMAAALDLVRVLLAEERIGPIYVMAAEPDDAAKLADRGAVPWQGLGQPFHFGRTLAGFVDWLGTERLVYFGGASAPLLEPELLAEALDLLERAEGPEAVVNNYHSTDWALLNQASSLRRLADRLVTDNPLGWILGQDAGYRVHALPPSAATRADIDTPTDLLLLQDHAHLGPAVRDFLAQAQTGCLARVSSIREVMRTPAKNVTIIGRSSSHLWQSLEKRVQIWVRILVEERGMLASGRLERGEVRSLVGQILDEWGPRLFLERLASMTDAVLWDTRVWMAGHGGWPPASERFAADLGWADQIEDRALRELTEAVNEAPIPILTGGHGVVAGSIYALVETLG
jgi:hypothetical protein